MSDPNDPGTNGQAPPADDPVTEAQTAADQASVEASQALANPQADLNALLDSLRTVQVQLFGIEVVQQVQQLSDAEKQAFVASRLHLGSVINQLNTAQLSQIADALAQHTGELRQGIQSLNRSLDTLTGAASWASAINSVIAVIGQIIPLL
jgi:hypothetical protein